jgi:hypothetical protein
MSLLQSVNTKSTFFVGAALQNLAAEFVQVDLLPVDFYRVARSSAAHLPEQHRAEETGFLFLGLLRL